MVSLVHPRSTQLTAAARFRQSERYYCSMFECFILQNLRVKAQMGFRVNFKCYQMELRVNFISSVNALTQWPLTVIRTVAMHMNLALSWI